ncbi:MAG TPA: hypothetical protein VLB50_03120 [Ignavibacteriaceae bacterium]|nr:hypothetical protein [Ignavibacteriaceae bacterium]
MKRKEDLATLINLCYSGENEQLLENLSFTSKYVQGLLRVLRLSSTNADVKNTSIIKRDLSTNMEKIREKIEQILSSSNEQTRQYFEENYLRLSQNNLLNLIELISDLEWTKKYLNYLKRESPN